MRSITQRYSVKLWIAKKQKAESKTTAQKYAVIECLRQFQNEMVNQYTDFKRRGFSNRNGANNRTYRKHLNIV